MASPGVRLLVDVGNMILFGFAQDWLRTVGRCIVRIHLKVFCRKGYQWTNLLAGDEAYLTDLASRIDKIIAMV
jgi:hypothetical protein